jgi:hypothetical protein
MFTNKLVPRTAYGPPTRLWVLVVNAILMGQQPVQDSPLILEHQTPNTVISG